MQHSRWGQKSIKYAGSLVPCGASFMLRFSIPRTLFALAAACSHWLDHEKFLLMKDRRKNLPIRDCDPRTYRRIPEVPFSVWFREPCTSSFFAGLPHPCIVVKANRKEGLGTRLVCHLYFSVYATSCIHCTLCNFLKTVGNRLRNWYTYCLHVQCHMFHTWQKMWWHIFVDSTPPVCPLTPLPEVDECSGYGLSVRGTQNQC